MSEETCVICGEPIPEGQQVCSNCENRVVEISRCGYKRHTLKVGNKVVLTDAKLEEAIEFLRGLNL